jgi:hypothetical protein
VIRIFFLLTVFLLAALQPASAQQRGERFEGTQVDGKYHGHGYLHTDRNISYYGEFDHGNPVGRFVRYRFDEERDYIVDYGEWYQGIFIPDPSPALTHTERYILKKISNEDDARLDGMIRNLHRPEVPRPHLFYLVVGGDGSDDVFRSEAGIVSNVIDQRFGASRRGIVLVNDRHYQRWPLATRKSIRRSLNAIISVMDTERDVLLIHLASHGGSSGELILQQPGLPQQLLYPEDLTKLLSATPSLNLVLVVSACQSGKWLQPLSAADRIILTSARHDRPSYGCGSRSEMTWFSDLLYRVHSFTLEQPALLAQDVKIAIAEREQREGVVEDKRSLPQAALGSHHAGVAERIRSSIREK